MEPSKEQVSSIASALASARFAALCTLRESTINARFMVFAADEALRHFFLLTHEAADKVDEVKLDRRATLCVLAQPPGGALDDSAELTAIGTMEVSGDLTIPWVETGLRLLLPRAPELQVILDSRDLGAYRMLRLTADTLVFQTYGGAAARAPKTILRFTA